MTVIVGIRCKDGVVIGADGSTTLTDGRNKTIEQPSEKIEIVSNEVIIAGTGEVGLNQRFCNIVKKNHDAHKFQQKSNANQHSIVAKNRIGKKVVFGAVG